MALSKLLAAGDAMIDGGNSCHSRHLSRERSYNRLRNIDAKAADREKTPLLTAVGIWPLTGLSPAGLNRCVDCALVQANGYPVFGDYNDMGRFWYARLVKKF